MPRYIDAKELLAWYDDIRKREREILSENYHKERKDEARIKISTLDKMYFKVRELEDKTADVEEIKHGEWEEVETESRDSLDVASMRCSECDRYHNEVYHYGDPTEMAHYCPYCGAKMDGKENEDD